MHIKSSHVTSYHNSFDDSTINKVPVPIIKSSNIVVIEQCRYFFHIELPSVQLQRRFE